MVSQSLRPYSDRLLACSWSSHHWNNSSLGLLQSMCHRPRDVAIQGQIQAVDQFPHRATPSVSYWSRASLNSVVPHMIGSILSLMEPP